jgi:hypothetical protein
VRVELDLAGAVNDEVIVLVRSELLVQPIEVVKQVPRTLKPASASGQQVVQRSKGG